MEPSRKRQRTHTRSNGAPGPSSPSSSTSHGSLRSQLPCTPLECIQALDALDGGDLTRGILVGAAYDYPEIANIIREHYRDRLRRRDYAAKEQRRVEDELRKDEERRLNEQRKLNEDRRVREERKENEERRAREKRRAQEERRAKRTHETTDQRNPREQNTVDDEYQANERPTAVKFEHYAEEVAKKMHQHAGQLSARGDLALVNRGVMDVHNIIQFIATQATTPHATFETRRSALVTLRRIGETILMCGTPQGHEALKYFQHGSPSQNDSFVDAMRSITDAMTDEERKRMCAVRDRGCTFLEHMMVLAEMALDANCFVGLGSVLVQLNGMSEQELFHSEDTDNEIRALFKLFEGEDPNQDLNTLFRKYEEEQAQTRAHADTTLAQLAAGDIGGVISSCYDSRGNVRKDAVSQALHVYCEQNMIYPGMFPAKGSRKRRR